MLGTSVLKDVDSSIGWLPLHYACRHCAKDEELIEYLILLYEDAVTTQDKFYRCPLHIAVNSKPLVRVI
jgi:ankyrin repeat protein